MRKFKVKINGQEFFVEVEEVGNREDEKPTFKKNVFKFDKSFEPSEKKIATDNNTNKNAVYAQLPGTIVKILKNEGENVSLKDPVLVLEAMKMENEVFSHIEGKVKKMYVRQGQKVAKGDILFEVE